MPVFLLSLLGGLVTVAGSIVGRVLLSLGIGYVSYKGISVLLTSLKSQAISSLTSIPPEMLQIVGLAKLDICLNILFSALAARLVIMGLTSDTFTRMVIK